jgi:hypothetical protein
LRLQIVATSPTSVSSRKGDLPQKNRVWDFFDERPRFAYQIDPQALETHRVPKPNTTNIASDIPLWLSRDPIGERGGVNLYGFVGNDGVNHEDLLGLETWCYPLITNWGKWEFDNVDIGGVTRGQIYLVEEFTVTHTIEVDVECYCIEYGSYRGVETTYHTTGVWEKTETQGVNPNIILRSANIAPFAVEFVVPGNLAGGIAWLIQRAIEGSIDLLSDDRIGAGTDAFALNQLRGLVQASVPKTLIGGRWHKGKNPCKKYGRVIPTRIVKRKEQTRWLKKTR